MGLISDPVPRIALIGCGAWGKNWARNLHAAGALAVLCDADSDHLSTIAKQYPEAASSTSSDTVVSSSDVDGIVVATPASTHFSIARLALESDKDVLVEKPLAMRVEDGVRLNEVATARSRILMVGHVLEYHPAIERLRNLIAGGRLGRVNHIYSHRLNLGTFRTEENALWSFAPHDIAVILRLLSKTPDSIACHGGSYLNRNIADLTLTSMSFPDGVFSHVFVSWLHPFKEQRLVVVGDRRMAVFDDLQAWEQKLVLYEHQVEWKFGHEPVAGRAAPVPELLQPCEPLRAECDAFLQAIRTRTAPLTDGPSGIKVLRVLEAAQRSLNHQGQPIEFRQHSGSGSAFIHPTAVIDPGAVIGAGTKVWHFAHVMGGSAIGKDCVLGQNVFVGANVSIGDRVKIQNNVSVYEGVTLEDDVFCGPSAVFTNVKRPRSEISQRGAYAKTLVRRGATIGANSTIVCGSTIGEHALIGAGAVVTKAVPDYAVVTGIPGRVVGFACRCANGLDLGSMKDDLNVQCSSCGRAYQYSARDRTVVNVGRSD